MKFMNFDVISHDVAGAHNSMGYDMRLFLKKYRSSHMNNLQPLAVVTRLHWNVRTHLGLYTKPYDRNYEVTCSGASPESDTHGWVFPEKPHTFRPSWRVHTERKPNEVHKW